MTNLQKLIEEAKKEFERKWQYDEFTYESTGFFDMDEATDFLEAQMRLAYRAGAEGVRDVILGYVDSCEHKFSQEDGYCHRCFDKKLQGPRFIEQAEAFLSTLTDV